jgi:HK97 family phage major capsid protein
VDEAAKRNFREYMLAVRGQKWPETRTQSVLDPTTGGYLVPEVYMPGLKSIAAEGSIIRQRATVIPAGTPPDAKVNIPVLNQGANGEFAGVSVVWLSEGGTKTQTTASITEVELEPYEVAASIYVTDKLLRNAPETMGIFEGLLTGAYRRSEETKFLNGNGVGCPLGIMQTAAHIDVTRTAASSIGFADVRNMFTRYLASSWANGAWVANQTTLPQLIAIADAVGNSIYIQGDVTKKIPASLFGLPVIFTGMTPVLGSAGDLMLIDPSYYLIKDGSGPFVASSPHVFFTTNVTVIKMFSNVDGDSWVSAPLLLEDGSTTVSPFIVLN